VGAVDYLAKPIEKDVLLSKVRVFLELDRQTRELEKQLVEIQQLKQQNEQLLQALGDGVIAVDSNGFITFVNPAMNLLFALDIQAVVGRAITDVLFTNIEGVKAPWNSGDIHLATSKNERFQRDVGFFVKTDSGMMPAQVQAAAIPSQESYRGAVITLRIGESEKVDQAEEVARKGRKQTRKRVGAVMRLFDRNTGLNIGRLVNISLEGFKLASKDEMLVGSRYPVSMILPETLAGSNTLSFDAQAVWCRPAEDMAGEYRIGFRIVKISENDLRILVQLIERY
jgi:PAS domain-containing protein